MKTVIGIVGESGSGKSEVAKIFESMGCSRISLSDVLREIATKIGLSHSRDNLICLGNALRDQFGPEILAKGIEGSIQKMESEFVVVESIRNPEELRYLRQRYTSTMIGIEMDELRKFELMQRRGREGDPKTLEEYLAFKKHELGTEVDNNGIKIQECLELCDVRIKNNDSLEHLFELVAEINLEIGLRNKEK